MIEVLLSAAAVATASAAVATGRAVQLWLRQRRTTLKQRVIVEIGSDRFDVSGKTLAEQERFVTDRLREVAEESAPTHSPRTAAH